MSAQCCGSFPPFVLERKQPPHMGDVIYGDTLSLAGGEPIPNVGAPGILLTSEYVSFFLSDRDDDDENCDKK